MKNEFVGDINDFAKFGLLKCLADPDGPAPENPGVLWYLTADEGRFGNHVGYLQPSSSALFRACDAALHEQLGRIVHEADRCVQRIQSDNVLPACTKYFDVPVPRGNRTTWFKHAAGSLANCSLVFLDPDNGLAPEASASIEHATEAEAAHFLGQGQSVVSIQFLHRRKPHSEQLRDWLTRAAAWPSHAAFRPFALRWRKTISVGFLILPASPDDERRLRARVKQLLRSSWGRFFDEMIELQ